MRGNVSRPKKRIRKQRAYHSSSDDSDASETGFAPVDLNESDEDIPAQPLRKVKKAAQAPLPDTDTEEEGARPDPDTAESADDDDDDEDGTVDGETGVRANHKPASKRNDPEAFSTSIHKILSTKLSQSARKDPVLSRSREAAQASSKVADERLENRAKAKLRAERKEALERGRITDVLGFESGKAGEIAADERRLRKIAQRGVTRMFNAVRAAQVKAEQTAKEERKKGTVGFANREEKINEMSKQGFMELISGKKGKPIEEA